MLFYQESRTQSELVYHKSVLIEENERSWLSMNIEEKVASLSSFSRWPPYPEEIDNKCVVIPDLLQ